MHICTKATRPGTAGGPAWGTADIGRLISETDTGLVWKWVTGNLAQRVAPSGILKRSNGDWARNVRTADFSTMSTSQRVVVSVTNVVVPEGRRPLMVVANFAWAKSDDGAFRGVIARSHQNDTGPNLDNWSISTKGQIQGGISRIAFEPSGLPAGEYSWSFQVYRVSGVSTPAEIIATPATPTEISIVEI